MQILRKIKKIVINNKLLLLFFVFLLIYIPAITIFYQQDEWFSFGNIIGFKDSLIFHRFNPREVNHFVPLDMFILVNLFKIGWLNNYFYNIVGLSIHFINAVLIYKIIHFLTKTKNIAFVSSLIFITSSNSAELTMWPFISINTIALTFALISIIFFIHYLNNDKITHAIFNVIFMLLSLLTLEYSAGLIAFFPITLLISSKKISKIAKYLFPFASGTALYLIIRLANSSGKSVPTEFPLIKIFNFLFLYLSQTMIPQNILNPIVKTLGQQHHINENDMVIVLVLVGLVFAGMLLLIYRKVNQKLRNVYLVLLLLFATSSLPFVFIPEEYGGRFLSPRYLYFGISAFAILLGYLIYSFKAKKNLLYVITLFLIFIGILGNLQKEVELNKVSVERLEILNYIKSSYPILNDKALIYTESDTSYYGLPDNVKILPFQSGLGQTLLVWYQKDMHYPEEFYTKRFLWKITDQGFKEENEKGFGYYRDYELLKKAIKENNISINSVYAFKWISNENALYNITSKTRNLLQKEL